MAISESVLVVAAGVDTELIAAAARTALYVENRGTCPVKMSPSTTTQTSTNLGLTLYPGEGHDLSKGFPLKGATGAAITTYVGAWRCWNYGPGSAQIYLHEVT